MRKFDIRDILIFIGLVSMGAGLFFWFGIGVSLTICGGIVVAVAVLGK